MCKEKNHATHSYLKCIIADLAFIHWKWHFFSIRSMSILCSLHSLHAVTSTLRHCRTPAFFNLLKISAYKQNFDAALIFFLSSKLFFRRCCHNSFQFYSLEIVRSHSNMFKNVCKALRISSIYFFSTQRTFNSLM